jgi:hypothetical protein
MVEEVKQVLPGLGNAFVHACLAVMAYNTQATLNLLLEGGELPYPLNLIDRSLGAPQGKRARAEAPGQAAQTEDERDEAFIRIQKEYLRNLERGDVSGVVEEPGGWGGG